MGSQRMDSCTVCKEVRHVRYVDLYVIGSEGSWLCRDCEMEVVQFVRGRMMYHGELKIKAILDEKERLSQPPYAYGRD